MSTYWNSVQSSLEVINQNLTRAMLKFYPQEQASKLYERFHTAKMSHNRLKALGDHATRECQLDKLREAAPKNSVDAQWSKTAKPEVAGCETAEQTEAKLRRELWRAQHRQSQVRLEAFVSTLSPKELAENEREGKRLNPNWQLPRSN